MQTSQPDPEPKPDCIERSDEMTNDTKVSLNSNSNVKPRIVKKSPEVEKGSVVRVQPLESHIPLKEPNCCVLSGSVHPVPQVISRMYKTNIEHQSSFEPRKRRCLIHSRRPIPALHFWCNKLLLFSLFASSECLYYERMHLRILRRLEDPKRPHSFLHLAREWYEAFDIITNMLSLIIAESELACAETMKIPESRQDKTEGSNEVGGQVLLVW
ncbi:hypothetical protein ACO22_02850 [Paracoccidioides brasiliensis]|uniref:Uncharacterized protein n=1 Tax=Paracoccidioides brasiliensis TaxID=121759 RepID=A0A1D2JHL1_PARBR|nr:hypothetical protein ACO22_02850 [Paracoccidioides brasiliensis]